MIIMDDLRPALKCYGDTAAVTPNIDKLASKSFIFTNAYAQVLHLNVSLFFYRKIKLYIKHIYFKFQQSLCAPSRNSLLTGRRPDTLHLYDFYSYWRDNIGNFTTLPQYMKSYGYETISIGKVFHPGITSNFTDDYPISWSHPTYHSPAETFMHKSVCMDDKLKVLRKNLICPVDVNLQPLATLPDIDSTKEAIRQLNFPREIPTFLAVGIRKPHIPFRFPAEYLAEHDDVEKFEKPAFNYVPYELPTVAFNPYLDVRSRDDTRMLNISFPFGPIPHEFGIGIRQAYYAAVTYVDNLIGQIMEHVNFTNTVVMLTSDHGWSLGEHAEWAKYSNYDVSLRVPLIIYSPEYKPINDRNKISEIVELLDIFPTIVDLAHVPNIPVCESRLKNELTCAEGKSLVPLMANENVSNGNGIAFSQYPRPSQYPTMTPNSDKPKLKDIKIMGYSLRTKQYRYTIWVSFDNVKFQMGN